MEIRRLATAALIASTLLAHGENIVLTPTPSNVWLVIHGGSPNKRYDIFSSTNLRNWQLKSAGTLGQTNFAFDYIPFATNAPPPPQPSMVASSPPPPPGSGSGAPSIPGVGEFYRWGNDTDTDADGFTDAYEVIVLRRSPHSTNTPVLQIVNPTGQLSTPTVNVVGSFTEGISSIRFVTDVGESSGRIMSQVWTPAGSNNWVGSYVSTFSGSVSLQAGTNQVTVIAIDDRGNSFTQQAVYVYTPVPDTSAPGWLSNWPANGATVTQTNFIMHGALDDTSGTVILSNLITGATSEASIMGSHYNGEIELREGENTIGILATDAAGNQSWSSINVTCDPTAPTAVVNVVRPAGNNGPVNALDVYGGLSNTTNATVIVNGVVATNISHPWGSWHCRIPATGQPLLIETTPAGGTAGAQAFAASSGPSISSSHRFSISPQVRLSSVSWNYYRWWNWGNGEYTDIRIVDWNDVSGGRVTDNMWSGIECSWPHPPCTFDLDIYGLDQGGAGGWLHPPDYAGHITFPESDVYTSYPAERRAEFFRGSSKLWTGGLSGSASNNLWCVLYVPGTYDPGVYPYTSNFPPLTPNFSIGGKDALPTTPGAAPHFRVGVFILDYLADNAVFDITPRHKDNNQWHTGRMSAQKVSMEVRHSIFGGGLRDLVDHPALRGHDRLRSPKFVFGKEDYINFVVFGIPPGSGDNFLQVKVTSESDPTGVTINLSDNQSETQSGAPNPTPVYMNNWQAGELLYLSNATSEGPRDTIKVLEEEVLTFKLFYRNAKGVITFTGLEKTVMVDRGEFSVAGIAEYAGDNQKYREEMQKGRVNWWQVGYRDNINTYTNNPNHLAEVATFENMIRDGGADPLTFEGEADFPYTGSHGHYGGFTVSMRSAGQNTNGFFIENGALCRWNTDVEFAYIDTCNIPALV